MVEKHMRCESPRRRVSTNCCCRSITLERYYAARLFQTIIADSRDYLVCDRSRRVLRRQQEVFCVFAYFLHSETDILPSLCALVLQKIFHSLPTLQLGQYIFQISYILCIRMFSPGESKRLTQSKTATALGKRWGGGERATSRQ